jgi:hypothetical protein
MVDSYHGVLRQLMVYLHKEEYGQYSTTMTILHQGTDQTQEAVRQVSQLPDDENPVKKVVLVFVSRNKGELYLDELEGDEGGDRCGNGGATGGARQAANEREWLQAIYSQLASLRRGLEAQLTILERLETQRARDSRAMLANLVKLPGSPWCGMLLLQKQ